MFINLELEMTYNVFVFNLKTHVLIDFYVIIH